MNEDAYDGSINYDLVDVGSILLNNAIYFMNSERIICTCGRVLKVSVLKGENELDVEIVVEPCEHCLKVNKE